jgi:hypothetical protein
MTAAIKDRTLTPAQMQRADEAKSAWSEYLGEREALAKRSAELKAMRLEAAEKAEKAEKAAAKAAARKKKA